MDYGFQLLRHVVQQVFGNLGPAARITILPAILAYAGCAIVLFLIVGPTFFELMQGNATGFDQNGEMLFASDAEAAAFAGRIFLGMVLCIPVFLIFYSWAAVGWHRYVLLEEGPSGVAARWSGPQIKSYIWAIVRLSLLMVLVAFVVSLGIGIVTAILQSPAVLLVVSLGVGIGFTWMFTRLGLVLPAAALGEYMKLGDSWGTTARVSGEILLPIIVIPIVFFLIQSVLGLLPVIGVILTLVVFWVQMLVNLALLTTLYGNLVEGRQLN